MDAKRFLRARALPLLALVAFLPACSKYGRLGDGEKIVGVRLGTGGGNHHLTAGTPQPGGVVIWGKSNTGLGMSVLLPTDTAYQDVNLPYGDWVFYAAGWTGSTIFSGTTRCGQTSVHVDSTISAVTVPIGLTGCSDPFFSASGSIQPLRIITCNTFANLVDGGSLCDNLDLGDFASYQAVAMGYAPAPIGGEVGNDARASACVNLPSNSSVTTSLQIPDGSGGGSPIFIKLLAYPSASCAGTPVEFNLRAGLRGGTPAGDAVLYTGANPYLGSNALFLKHGPRAAPTVSSLAPASGGWGGKISVVISGANFDPNATVTVGGVNCPVTARSGSTSITCTPARSATLGAKSVVVTSAADGQTGTNTYTYVDDGFGNSSDYVSGTVGSSFAISANFSVTAANTAGSRPFHTYRNIMNIDSATGKVLSLRNYVAGDFQVGDDVLWHVSAATTNATCATGLGVGQFGSARVTAVDSTNGIVTIDTPISTTVNNTALANTTRNSGQTFCAMQLVRVPNFEDVNFTASVTANAYPFDLANGVGGILVFRANGNVAITGTSTISFTANNGGFLGGTSALWQGDGSVGAGASSVSTANGSGGGAGFSTAGGGGGGGTAVGGSPPGVTGGSGQTCQVSNHCAIFGGGGGAGAGSGLGGNGGGIVLVYARSFSSTSATVSVLANGASGAAGSSGGGGGAGGTAFLQSTSLTNMTVDIHADGGAPGTGTYAGAGGGGGLNGLFSCSAAAAAGVTSQANAGTGTYSGTNGTPDNGSYSPGMGNGSFYCP